MNSICSHRFVPIFEINGNAQDFKLLAKHPIPKTHWLTAFVPSGCMDLYITGVRGGVGKAAHGQTSSNSTCLIPIGQLPSAGFLLPSVRLQLPLNVKKETWGGQGPSNRRKCLCQKGKRLGAGFLEQRSSLVVEETLKG